MPLKLDRDGILCMLQQMYTNLTLPLEGISNDTIWALLYGQGA